MFIQFQLVFVTGYLCQFNQLLAIGQRVNCEMFDGRTVPLDGPRETSIGDRGLNFHAIFDSGFDLSAFLVVIPGSHSRLRSADFQADEKTVAPWKQQNRIVLSAKTVEDGRVGKNRKNRRVLASLPCLPASSR